MLFEWNETRSDYPRDRCAHELIETQALRSPHSVAVRTGDDELTYEQLNARANELARELRRRGVGPESLVGIFIENSPRLLVAILAIWKAGGAYVPLDPSYPCERLAFKIRDAGMKLIVTQTELRTSLPVDDVEMLCVELAPSGEPLPNLPSNAGRENLAYVIYTSGSTGAPKGVMVPHRALVNYLCWAAKAYNVEAGSGAPVHSSIAFDLTITSLLTPLLVGRAVHILPKHNPLETLATILHGGEHFSLVKITPAHLDLLCAEVTKKEIAAATRMFVVGGEALFSRSLESWRRCAPDAVLVNEYGPTETVVGCCVYFAPLNAASDGAVPIGRPIANTQLYVLDAHLQPVRAGEVGELYIAGDGVARGYLNQPELTAQSFIPNPYDGDGTSTRMYKTGDLVRHLQDGNLEYVGRIDDQIKLRSYRIEPAEIEAALRSHPHVRSAAVVVQTDAKDGRQLVAFLVAESDDSAKPAALREHLKSRLPAYMIPAVFTLVNELPLTANGKIDRAALLHVRPAVSFASVAPFSGTPTEERLAKLWSQALKCHVEPHHDFFDLGGDSLAAVRLAAQINQSFKTHLGALALYQHPTVAQLARLLEKKSSNADGAKLVPIRVHERSATVFFLNAPLEFARLASRLGGDQSLYISDVPFRDDAVRAALRFETAGYPTLDELIRPHTAQILESGLPGPCFLAGYSSYGIVAFEVAHQLLHAGKAVDGIFLFDADMKIPPRKHLQARLVRHWRHTMNDGPQHLWRKTVGRVIRARQSHAAVMTARNDFPADVPLSNHEVSWLTLQRIWDHVLRRYKPKTLDTNGVLFRANISIYNEVSDYDGCLGWRGLFRRGLTTINIPGDHVSMWKEPDVVALTDSWTRSLQTLRSGASAVLYSAPTVLAALTCSF